MYCYCSRFLEIWGAPMQLLVKDARKTLGTPLVAINCSTFQCTIFNAHVKCFIYEKFLITAYFLLIDVLFVFKSAINNLRNKLYFMHALKIIIKLISTNNFFIYWHNFSVYHREFNFLYIHWIINDYSWSDLSVKWNPSTRTPCFDRIFRRQENIFLSNFMPLVNFSVFLYLCHCGHSYIRNGIRGKYLWVIENRQVKLA